MKPLSKLIVLAGVVIVGACVTINVYFPEAAAEEAADRFIDRVIGPDEEGEADDNRGAWRFNPLDLVFPAAHAQVDIDIDTPAVRAIQSRMEARFDSQLRDHFNSGAVGLTSDAMIEIRDLSSVPLAERNRLKAAVAEDNQDRAAVYREIAVANGHPEWESQIRATFAERWIAKARPGWYYQSGGGWQQK